MNIPRYNIGKIGISQINLFNFKGIAMKKEIIKSTEDLKFFLESDSYSCAL